MSTLDKLLAETLADRHPSVRQVASWFMIGDPGGPSYPAVREAVQDLAVTMLLTIPDSAELTDGLRKLLEAQDSFLRADVTAAS